MDYRTLKLTELKNIAKEKGIHGVSTLRKEELVQRLEKADTENTQRAVRRPNSRVSGTEHRNPRTYAQTRNTRLHTGHRTAERSAFHAKREIPERRYEGKSEQVYRKPAAEAENPAAVERGGYQESRNENMHQVEGFLEVMSEGFGFIRSNGYMPGENDTYVTPPLIRRFKMRTGDYVIGIRREKSLTEKTAALQILVSVNGMKPNELYYRPTFERFTPIFPDERYQLETSEPSAAMRIMNLITPVGKGQRGLIVAPPKAGKTTLLKSLAKAVLANHPDIHLMILLIDERPEEVTDIRESIVGNNVEVMASTFDELPEHHKHISEIAIERAKRLVEQKKDVVILLDSITRLTRAYNLTGIPSGRTLSGGLDPAALHMPKRFFGAARNTREAGSLTIIATALIETGSKLDDVVYEEFKGTGNMELTLSRRLQERRIFPAIDISKSGTRREDLLLSEEEQQTAARIHQNYAAEKDMEQLISICQKAKTQEEFQKIIAE